MAVEHFVWSLIAPLGFRTASYASQADFIQDLETGNVQDPRVGGLRLLQPTGVAMPPVALSYAPAIGGAPVYDFDLLEFPLGDPITGHSWVTYFWPDGTTTRTPSGGVSKNLPDGTHIVRAVADDGRQGFAVVQVTVNPQAAPSPPPEPTKEELLTELIDDEKDIKAYLRTNKIKPPENWAGMTFKQKINWLSTQEPAV